jgi:hypothetical protein
LGKSCEKWRGLYCPTAMTYLAIEEYLKGEVVE